MDRQNFENQTFNELPATILCSNFFGCTFNVATKFDKCNLIGCTFNAECEFYLSNVITQEEYDARFNEA